VLTVLLEIMPIGLLTTFQLAFLLSASAVLLLGMVAGLWITYGRGPRLNRAYKRFQQFLAERNWKEALAEARQIGTLGCLSPVWQVRARRAQGECHRLAGEMALSEKRFEEALEHFQTAARLLDTDEAAYRDQVVAEMLNELRRRFADGRPAPSTGPGQEKKVADEKGEAERLAIPELLSRISRIQSPCLEAIFWEALFHVREGRLDKGLTLLHEARSAESILDPPLYLGALLLRAGRTQEALRYLADANRIAPDCPFVPWQLGMAMVAAGGADNLAIRPLQKALGAKGLPAWIKAPQKIWQEAMPGPETSYVARLAAKFLYSCPVFGNDLAAMIRQAQMALAQAQYRLGHFEEAADLFASILQESPPTLSLLRGLGLALAKLERYDEAFKHLRAAQEWEFSREPKATADRGNSDNLTAGYLALCGAKGKPSRPEDKATNVMWALRLLGKFDVEGDAEWAQLNSAVFTEARLLGLSLPVQELVRWCNVLASVDASDATAATAYHELAKLSPEAVKPEHSWLYVRAAQQHGIQNEGDLVLFQRAFFDEDATRAFYEKRGWDFEEVEYLFLTRWASAPEDTNAMRSPDGTKLPDYLNRNLESFLLERSKRKEQAGLEVEALASVEVLLKLSPRSAAGHDRLACLNYRRGDLARAAQVLAAWHALSPEDHWPLLRLAIMEQKLGNSEASLKAIQQAMSLTNGPTRAAIAFLGGRLAMASRKLEQALQLFDQCLQDDPAHASALWCLAVVRYLLGDRTGLIGMAEQMSRPEINNSRVHYLAAIAHLSAGDYARAIQASQRAIKLIAEDGKGVQQMAAECRYVKGLAHWHQQDIPAASVELQKAMFQEPPAPSADHARALLGRIRFSRQAYDEAVDCWKAIANGKRQEWKLDETMRSTVFLAGLAALCNKKYESAANFFQEARHRDFLEPRLPALRIAALVRAARQLLSASRANGSLPGVPQADGSRSELEAAARFLGEAVQAGSQDATVAHMLGLAYKRQGNTRAARQALQSIARPDADTSFQMGILSLDENQLAQADQEFERAWQLKPDFFEAGRNLLFTRLSRGQIETALTILPRVIELTIDSYEQRLLSHLEIALRASRPANGAVPLHPGLADLTREGEEWFLKLAQSLGNLQTARGLLTTLSACRPKSAILRDALLEIVVIQGKQLLDRCEWAAAEKLLAPWLREREMAPLATQIGLLNLLGCCAALGQEFETARHFFSAAILLAATDARLHQNLALANEWQGQLALAGEAWNRYLELLDARIPAPPDSSEHAESLAFECLKRLATRYSEREQWSEALAYLERAQHLRPDDQETLERLFQLLNQLKRPEEARRALRQLQELRPNEPQLKLLELELIEVNSLDNVNRVVSGIERISDKHPKDEWVQNRTAVLLATIITYLEGLNRQVGAQKAKARARLRRLPKYKAKWPEMSEYLRELNSRSQKIRTVAARCLSLASLEYQRQMLNTLIQQINRELERGRAVV
jgi:tetratricopeptide (TPR) repeat protein